MRGQGPLPSTATSSHPEPVVVKVLKAERAAADHLHLAVKALGDAVVAAKTPHTGDLVLPGLESLAEANQGSTWRLLELLEVSGTQLDQAGDGEWLLTSRIEPDSMSPGMAKNDTTATLNLSEINSRSYGNLCHFCAASTLPISALMVTCMPTTDFGTSAHNGLFCWSFC